jgi:hypothetical protein
MSLFRGSTPLYLQLDAEPSKKTRILVSPELFVAPSADFFNDLGHLIGSERFVLTL